MNDMMDCWVLNVHDWSSSLIVRYSSVVPNSMLSRNRSIMSPNETDLAIRCRVIVNSGDTVTRHRMEPFEHMMASPNRLKVGDLNKLNSDMLSSALGVDSLNLVLQDLELSLRSTSMEPSKETIKSFLVSRTQVLQVISVLNSNIVMGLDRQTKFLDL